ncbi:MAG: response regulator [Desulfuromonadales bacterium]
MTLSLKILAMEDEPLLLHALERACRGRHLELKTAATAEEVLAETECHRYDLFLLGLDLEIPQHIELLKKVDERCAYVPIIVMAMADADTSGLHDVIRSVRKQGAWHLLEKPFRLENLFGFVDEMVRDHEEPDLPGHFMSHNYDREKRRALRRSHIQSVNFSYKTISQGDARRISITGILTDISEGGFGVLSRESLRPGQVVRFDDDFSREMGIVAWSAMVEKGTCRSGVKFC